MVGVDIAMLLGILVPLRPDERYSDTKSLPISIPVVFNLSRL